AAASGSAWTFGATAGRRRLRYFRSAAARRAPSASAQTYSTGTFPSAASARASRAGPVPAAPITGVGPRRPSARRAASAASISGRSGGSSRACRGSSTRGSARSMAIGRNRRASARHRPQVNQGRGELIPGDELPGPVRVSGKVALQAARGRSVVTETHLKHPTSERRVKLRIDAAERLGDVEPAQVRVARVARAGGVAQQEAVVGPPLVQAGRQGALLSEPHQIGPADLEQ